MREPNKRLQQQDSQCLLAFSTSRIYASADGLARPLEGAAGPHEQDSPHKFLINQLFTERTFCPRSSAREARFTFPQSECDLHHLHFLRMVWLESMDHLSCSHLLMCFSRTIRHRSSELVPREKVALSGSRDRARLA